MKRMIDLTIKPPHKVVVSGDTKRIAIPTHKNDFPLKEQKRAHLFS